MSRFKCWKILVIYNMLIILLIIFGCSNQTKQTNQVKWNIKGYVEAKDKFRAWQGVCTDGKYLYVTTDRNEKFELENIISVYTIDGKFVSEKRKAYTKPDSKGKFMSFGQGTIIDGKMYVTAYNFNASANPLESRAVIYNLQRLDILEEHDIGEGVAESISKYAGDFYICYHDKQEIRRFNSNYKLINIYPLSQKAGPDGGYQSIFWDGDCAFLNMHGANERGKVYSSGLDKYQFDGSSFKFSCRIKPPTYGSGQGVSKYLNRFYWADRVENKIVITNGI